MRGQSLTSAEASGESTSSVSFLDNSDNQLLQGLGSALKWPEKQLGFSFFSRWIPNKPEHGRWYLNLSYQLLDSLRAGIDYRPLTTDVSILANWRVFSENVDSWRPAMILGTSNDDFGDISSQSYYATLSKYLFEAMGTNVSLYGGATYIDKLGDLRPVGGLHLRRDAWSATFMYSGVDEHLTIAHDFGNHTLSFLLFDLNLPGIAYGFRF
ncbi:MAG TPA: hypothetical protein EYQ50_11370 [Verrucomicrobiales bacterium]|nr:hypothetical protein [Verrucomicrobiales bacterium]HIL71251.1 hypothetical protein [Verrucomicrobiota bacterium]